MFNKKLLAKIVLDHKKFSEQEKKSCDITHIDTRGYLSVDDNELLKYHLECACSILRKAYRNKLLLK